MTVLISGYSPEVRAQLRDQARVLPPGSYYLGGEWRVATTTTRKAAHTLNIPAAERAEWRRPLPQLKTAMTAPGSVVRKLCEARDGRDQVVVTIKGCNALSGCGERMTAYVVGVQERSVVLSKNRDGSWPRHMEHALIASVAGVRASSVKALRQQRVDQLRERAAERERRAKACGCPSERFVTTGGCIAT